MSPVEITPEFNPLRLAMDRRLNRIAGHDGDLVVLDVTVAPPGFDARFSPLWRRYGAVSATFSR